MPRHIKTAALAGHQEEADAKIRGTVEGIIADVAKRGDTAVHLSGGQNSRGECHGGRILQPPLRDRTLLGPQGAGRPAAAPLRGAERGFGG